MSMKLIMENWRKTERRILINENIEMMQKVTDQVKAYMGKAPDKTPRESWKVVDKYWGPWDKKNDALSDAVDDAESPQELKALMKKWQEHVKTMTPMLQKVFAAAKQAGAPLGKDIVSQLYKGMSRNLEQAKLMAQKETDHQGKMDQMKQGMSPEKQAAMDALEGGKGNEKGAEQQQQQQGGEDDFSKRQKELAAQKQQKQQGGEYAKDGKIKACRPGDKFNMFTGEPCP